METTNVADQHHLDSLLIAILIDELCLYFQSNLFKCILFNRPPIFATSISNQRDPTIEGISRTTNAVESWHYGIQSPVKRIPQGDSGNDAAVQKINFLDASLGQKNPKKKKNERLEERCRT